MQTNTTRRVSVHSNGSEANGRSWYAFMDDAATMIAFRSDATNLIDDDTNGVTDVFLHDLQTSETIRISETTNGEANDISTAPRVSPDGRYVAFVSFADNLTTDPKEPHYDLFLYDVQSQAISLVTRSWDGQATDGHSLGRGFSRDGRLLIFFSEATNIVPDDTNEAEDIFLYNIESGAVCRVNARFDGVEGDRNTWGMSTSTDGTVVAFETEATNLYSLDSNGAADVYLRIGQPFECDSYSAIRSLPDVNSNGVPDIAVAVPGSTRVHVRDGLTDLLISDVSFGDDPALDMVVMPDLNANGNPDIAILGERPSGQIRAQVKDSITGATTATVFFGDQYSGIDMAVVPDFSGNGLPELAVLGQEPGTDRVRVMVRDAATDTSLKSLFLGNRMAPSGVSVITDVTGNSIPEVVMMGSTTPSGQVQSQVRDANTAALHQTVFWADRFQPVKTIGMQDIDASGAGEIVALGLDPDTGAGRLQIRDASSRTPISTAYLGATSEVLDLAIVDDTNSNGYPDVAVLSRQDTGAPLVRVYDSDSGTLLKNVFYNSMRSPVGLAVLDDYSGNGAQELAVLGKNAGARQVQVKDAVSGTLVNSIDFP